MNKYEVGRAGEQMAAEFLTSRGYAILDRNWRPAQQTPVGTKARASGERRNLGELDIVALDGDQLVAVEVKTRSTVAFGYPAAALTAEKVNRLKALTGQWLGEQTELRPRFKSVRLDAIAIVLQPLPQVTHYQGIS